MELEELKQLINRFQQARSDKNLAVLEGFHAIKHALRFGAEILSVVAIDQEQVSSLTAELAPDLAGYLRPELVESVVFEQLSSTPHRTGMMAIARRPAYSLASILADLAVSPLVLLEEPRNLGNLGAVIRVSAGAGAAGVITTGSTDPWHPHALRGSAGLHYALPVIKNDELPESDRLIIAVHPEGGQLLPQPIPPRSILVFGTERGGLSSSLLKRAERRITIPMQPQVSSLNLVTSVAIMLYHWRLGSKEA